MKKMTAQKKIKMCVDIRNIFICAAFVINIFNTCFQKVILIIMEDQVFFVQTCRFQQVFRFSAKESHPAQIPGFIFVCSVHDCSSREDKKAIIFFQVISILLCLICSFAFCDIMDQIIVPGIFSVTVIRQC